VCVRMRVCVCEQAEAAKVLLLCASHLELEI